MIKLKKCKFIQRELWFLRHIILADGIRTDPEKIAKMVALLSLTNLKKLRLRLGLFFYYWQYIKGFSDITRSMYKLIREENDKLISFEWMLAKQKAFKVIKVKLIIVSIIVHFNFNKLFILYIDVSGGGVEAILHQKDDNRREWIIICANRTFNEYKKKYPIIEQECLAVV